MTIPRGEFYKIANAVRKKREEATRKRPDNDTGRPESRFSGHGNTEIRGKGSCSEKPGAS